jgi:DNA-binding beta-propeller fold protein YncE
LYIVDTNNIIRKISLKQNAIITIAGQPGIGTFSGDGGHATSATLYKPMGLALDSNGNILVDNVFNHRVRKINLSTGIITTVVGSGQFPTNSTTA